MRALGKVGGAMTIGVLAACLAMPVAWAAGDAVKGAQLYDNGDNARGIPACVACHGVNGNSAIGANPKLAGQIPDYLVTQLKNYKSGTRINNVMQANAANLTPDDMVNLAAYLAQQTTKPLGSKNRTATLLGQKIFRAGIAERAVPACMACHGAAGAGIPGQYPRISGQHPEYINIQLAAFRAGAQPSSTANAIRKHGQMSSIAVRLTDEEMAALADYLSGLR